MVNHIEKYKKHCAVNSVKNVQKQLMPPKT